MISLLDKYVLKRFLFAYVMVVVVILTLFVIIDIPERIKKAKKSGCGRSLAVGTERCYHCNTQVEKTSSRCPRPTANEILVIHYSSNIPLIFYQMAPFLAVLGGMLAVSSLQQRNELIPMKVAGRSPLRIVMPILITTLFLGGVTWCIQEYFIPQFKYYVQKAGLLGKNRRQQPKAIPDRYGGVLLVDAYNTEEKVLFDLIYQRTDEDGHESYEVVASTGKWNEEKERWVLSRGARLDYDETGARKKLEGEGATDEDYVATSFDDDGYVLETSILPRDIFEAAQTLNSLSSQELREQQRRLPHDKQRMEVLLASRVAYPFAGLILMILGLPFVLDENGDTWKGVLLCMAICGCYYILTFVLLDLAKLNVFNAQVAAWAPNVFFLPIGGALMHWKGR
ncbi:MAG: LptF/LptG family permease [Planctomycetota bacterium]|nr:LptF/LptG family permease [Planctomycetota bacterium]